MRILARITLARTSLFVAALIILSALFSYFPLSTTSAYGGSAYGECFYGSSSGECDTNTTTETPSGLKVAINLVDGQVLPRTGYTVIMTPLNGAGSSFKQATIYIDGNLITTVTPGPNGTATWFWDTILHPGTVIRIVITDQTGQDTPQIFTIRIANENEVVTPPGGMPVSPTDQKPNQQSGKNPIVALFSQIGENTSEFIRSLPKELTFSFPWIIFILLTLQIIILLLHTRRELNVLRDIEAAAERIRLIGGLKSDFMNLLAHHLRTPLTTLQGGLELQSSESGVSSTATLQAVASDIHTTIDTILADASQDIEATPIVTSEHQSLRTYIPLLSILLLAGILAFGFIYLANSVTSLDTKLIDLIIQVLVYLLLCSFAIICFRQLHLRGSQRSRAEMVLAHESTLQTARDNAIEHVNERLNHHVATLRSLLPTLPANGVGLEFIKPALADLTKLSSKFLIANQLTDTKDQTPAKPYSLASLYEPVAAELQSKAEAKNISLNFKDNGSVETSKPELVSVVLQNLIENAIAYSPENSRVVASVTEDGKNSKITVTDNGDGLSKDQLSQLFQPFYKAEGSETYNHQGMGFSLYLDKLIATYLGGTIQASSEPHASTNFTVTLPRHTSA